MSWMIYLYNYIFLVFYMLNICEYVVKNSIILCVIFNYL